MKIQFAYRFADSEKSASVYTSEQRLLWEAIVDCSSAQSAANSATASQIQFTIQAKQLSIVKQQGQQMVELLQSVAKNIDTGSNFDGLA